MTRDSRAVWFGSALMLASYTFGFNFHNIVHELGHSVAIWIQGGKVHGLVLHPFLACYSPSTAVPNHVLLYAGGALFGGAATVLLPMLAWRHRTPYMMPLVMPCSAGLITTSKWMLLAPFTTSSTDYYFLIDLGVPSAVILVWGLLYLTVGVAVVVLFLPLVGISHDERIIPRVIVLESAVLPYLIAADVFYVVRGASVRFSMFLGLIPTAVFFAVVAWLSMWLMARYELFRRVQTARVETAHVAVAWASAGALIAVMLLITLPRDTVIASSAMLRRVWAGADG
jgi:hypothetical protein